MDASKLEWDRAKSQKSNLSMAMKHHAIALISIEQAIENISDHDQPELKAKAIELRRRFKDFGDVLKKKAAEP